MRPFGREGHGRAARAPILYLVPRICTCPTDAGTYCLSIKADLNAREAGGAILDPGKSAPGPYCDPCYRCCPCPVKAAVAARRPSAEKGYKQG